MNNLDKQCIAATAKAVRSARRRYRSELQKAFAEFAKQVGYADPIDGAEWCWGYFCEETLDGTARELRHELKIALLSTRILWEKHRLKNELAKLEAEEKQLK